MKHVKLFEDFLNEKGLWDNVWAKRKRGEKPAKPGQKGYPDEKSWDAAKKSDESVNEGRIVTKRKYTENYPAKHVYSKAHVRNKVLELLKAGKVTEEDFFSAISGAGAPRKWIQRNSQYFKVEEEGGKRLYSLSGKGHVVANSLQEIKESVEVDDDSLDTDDIYDEHGIEENLIIDPLDITKDVFYVSINGKTYGYGPKNGGNTEDLARSFKGMLKYSAGRALAWLKKNSDLVSGSTKVLAESLAPGQETLQMTIVAAISDALESLGDHIKSIGIIRPEYNSFDVAVHYKDGNYDEFSFHVEGGNVILSDFTFSKMIAKKGDSESVIAKNFKSHFQQPINKLHESKEEVLTAKDKEWVKSLGNNKVEYNDQHGSGDHTLSAILSLMAGGTLKWGGAADFGFDHVDMYDEESGRTVLPGATAGKYTFSQLLNKAKTLVKK
jgi:hypothetical protein